MISNPGKVCGPVAGRGYMATKLCGYKFIQFNIQNLKTLSHQAEAGTNKSLNMPIYSELVIINERQTNGTNTN